MNVTALLANAQQGHTRMMALWREVKPWLIAGHQLVLTIKPQTRSNAANSRMWVLLGALAEQVDWHGQKLTAEEWKDCCTAALKRQKVVPGIDGGFVVLGTSTRKMTPAEHAELQTFIEAFGAQHNVDFGLPMAPEDA